MRAGIKTTIQNNAPTPPLKTSNPGEALSTFIRASRNPKGETQLRVVKSTNGLFKTENKAQTLPKRREIDFFDAQNGQKWPLKSAKMSKILTQNLDFRGHL